jgi:hypothetical protein
VVVGELLVPWYADAEPGRDPAGLSRVALAPGFDQVGACLFERLFQGGLACFAVRAVAAPYVPRDQADRGLD